MKSATQQLLRGSLKLALALFVLMAVCAHAESAPNWANAARFGGSGTDAGAAVSVTKFGDRYVTGSFSSTASFGGKSLTSAGGTDIFLAKYATGGRLLWLIQAGGSGDDAANSLALDPAGNAYVTGWFVGTATFRSAGGQSKTVTGGDETIFIAKYSPAGALLWLQTGAGAFAAINRGDGLAVNSAANTVYITGVSQGNTTFSGKFRCKHRVHNWGFAGQHDVLLIRRHYKYPSGTRNMAHVPGEVRPERKFPLGRMERSLTQQHSP
jgi:hypothetical protein